MKINQLKEQKETSLINAISALRGDIYKYDRIFDQYRHYLMGYDFPMLIQKATDDSDAIWENGDDPQAALEALQKLNECLPCIVNEVQNIKQILGLNAEYTIEQINEINTLMVNAAGSINLVNFRIHLLSDPDQFLVNIHHDFIGCLADFNDSIIAYNKRRKNKLYTVKQARRIFNRYTESHAAF